MTTTAAKMIGHTLTVERIVDIPQMAGTVLHAQATTNSYSGPVLAFIERRDGAFVACHGTNDQRDDLHPYNDHWTNCRLLAENLSGLAGPYEDLRYVSLTVGETLPVRVTPAEGTLLAPTEIAAQMAVLADQLRTALLDPDGQEDGFTAVTAQVAEALKSLTGVTRIIREFADNSDGPEWTEEVLDAADELDGTLATAIYEAEALAGAVANAESADALAA